MKTSANQNSSPVLIAIGTSASAPSVPRIGPARPTRLGGRVVAQRLGHHGGAEKRDEHRRGGLDALAAQLDDMAHLVHEQQQHEPECELPAPEQAIGGDRDEHRSRRCEDLRLRQQQQRPLAELERQQSDDEQPAEPAPPPGLGRIRLTRKGLVLRVRLARRCEERVGARVRAGRARRRGARVRRRLDDPWCRCRPLRAHRVHCDKPHDRGTPAGHARVTQPRASEALAASSASSSCASTRSRPLSQKPGSARSMPTIAPSSSGLREPPARSSSR